jgi:hypothetical protein
MCADCVFYGCVRRRSWESILFGSHNTAHLPGVGSHEFYCHCCTSREASGTTVMVDRLSCRLPLPIRDRYLTNEAAVI